MATILNLEIKIFYSGKGGKITEPEEFHLFKID